MIMKRASDGVVCGVNDVVEIFEIEKVLVDK